jgi:hypothetical protein
MERPVTRPELHSAIAKLLEATGVSEPSTAIEVLTTPNYGEKLFAVIPSERARPILIEKLMPITGSPHPPAADVWIFDETQCAMLINLAAATLDVGSPKRPRRI